MKVKFLPQNVELEIKPNQSVMNLAHENNLPIRSVCNGMPSCAECRVKLVDGEYNVPPPSRKELNLIGTGYFIDQRRLSCQLYCFGDITIDLAEQLEKTNEGAVPKKFLARANKERAEDYHSVGGVLIEEDQSLIKQAEAEAEAKANAPREGGGRSGGRGGRGRDGGRGRPIDGSQSGGGGGRPGGGHGSNGGDRASGSGLESAGPDRHEAGSAGDAGSSQQNGQNREGGGGGGRRRRRRRR